VDAGEGRPSPPRVTASIASNPDNAVTAMITTMAVPTTVKRLRNELPDCALPEAMGVMCGAEKKKMR
jgi:hypothetical protein